MLLRSPGRLDLAERALQLFLTDDEVQAVTIAQELRALNAERKEMTDSCTQEAIKIVTQSDANNPVMTDDQVLVIFLPDCHESIAGIIAGKVREAYYKPAIVLTRAEDSAD